MHFATLDVFTDTPFLGNPLGLVVVEDKERAALETQTTPGRNTKLLIAKEFNLSETVFLYLRPGETLTSPDRSSREREISIFTTRAEIPFAGHPTIGTAYFILKHLGWDFVDTITPPAGPISISAPLTGGPDGPVAARIPHDVHRHAGTLRSLCARDDRAAAQIRPGLHEDDAVRAAELDAPVVSIVRGMTFLLVELPSLAHLAGVGTGRPLDVGSHAAGLLDAGPWGLGFVSRYYYVNIPRPQQAAEEDGGGVRVRVPGTERAIRARMMEPSLEDPATGSAASSLACYLSLLAGDAGADEVRYRITQGVEMGRTSDIEVHVISGPGDEGARVIKQVRLGGTARLVMTGDIKV